MKSTVLLIGAAVLLTGCGKTISDGMGPAPPTITLPQVSLQDVANYAHQLCNFAPTGQMIAEMLSTVVPGGPVVVSAATLGSAICAAYNLSVAPPLARRKARQVVGGWVVTPGAVNGVPIR